MGKDSLAARLFALTVGSLFAGSILTLASTALPCMSGPALTWQEAECLYADSDDSSFVVVSSLWGASRHVAMLGTESLKQELSLFESGCPGTQVVQEAAHIETRRVTDEEMDAFGRVLVAGSDCKRVVKAVRERGSREFTLAKCAMIADMGFREDDCAIESVRVVDSYGWPFRAASASLSCFAVTRTAPHFGSTSSGAATTGALLATPLADSWDRWRAFPTTVLWGGLIGNVCVWGVVCAAVASVGGAIRSRAWARQGRCEACGYSIWQGGRCPECGRHA